MNFSSTKTLVVAVLFNILVRFILPLGSTVMNFSGTKTLVVAVLFNILVRYML